MGAMTSGLASARLAISHEGIVNLVTNQDSFNQLKEGAQGVATAVSSVNETTGIEAIKTVVKVMALVIPVLVRLCVDVSTRIGNFETVMESRTHLLHGAIARHL